MLEIALTVCLLTQPERCKDVSLTYSAEAVTPMQLMASAQPEIARWLDEHPGYYARRWAVRRAGLFART